MHKVYVEKINFDIHREKIKEILEMLLCDAKNKNHDLYEHIEEELYEMAYGKKISEEMAEKWVEHMQPIGKYWNMTETTNAMYDLGYNHNEIDFFVVSNMMKNDYEELTQDNDELALKLAHDWLKDTDARECKLYQYWKYVIKKD